MALLHFLQRRAAQKGWRLTAAHFNHQLRGPESRQDEEFLRSHSRETGIPSVFGTADVAKLQHKSGKSIEMVARRLRHEFLAKAAVDSNCDRIALGHHADDQVELFFLRLFRGAGTEGLSGMSWMSPSPANPNLLLVRPLLGTWRQKVLDYVRSHKIKYRLDSSNQDTRVLRNRIRHTLLPLIRDSGFEIRNQILETCDILESDSSFIAEATRNWKNAPKGTFETLHRALQRSLLKQELMDAGVPPSFAKIEFLRMNPAKRLAVGRQKTLLRTSDGRLVLSNDEENRQTAAINETSCTHLRLTSREGSVRFETLALRWKIVPKRRINQSAPRSPQIEMFDADEVGLQIQLRHWRCGDRFQPIGLPQKTKLQDLFTNAKWSQSRRHQAVLAESQLGALFWVQGMRISEVFKITPKTKRVLVWEWRQESMISG